jgi:gas vesicle protein
MSRGYDEDVRSLVWFLAGIGVGATVALLFAPQTGKQTRRMLSKAAERGREYIEDTGDALRDSASDIRDRAGDLRDDLKSRSRDLYERGRDLARDAGEDAATLLDRGKKIVRG